VAKLTPETVTVAPAAPLVGVTEMLGVTVNDATTEVVLLVASRRYIPCVPPGPSGTEKDLDTPSPEAEPERITILSQRIS
jgi:hypothetical protein